MNETELNTPLCCPLGKADLILGKDNILCSRCGVIFPVRNGIPVLLIDEAVLPEGIKSISELECMKVTK